MAARARLFSGNGGEGRADALHLAFMAAMRVHGMCQEKSH